MRKLHDIKSTAISWFDKNGLKTCGVTAGLSGSMMLMFIPASADAYTYSMDTAATSIFSLVTKALEFCLGNEALATIFTLAVVGGVFTLVKKAKRAVK